MGAGKLSRDVRSRGGDGRVGGACLCVWCVSVYVHVSVCARAFLGAGRL